MASRFITFVLLLTVVALSLGSYEHCRDEPGFEKCADDEIDIIIKDFAKEKWEGEYRTKMNECLTKFC
ncbi:hypothetical protein PFISCL1PPCAC_24788 [Pristionchus fissidentatus]|uniref:Uncharacterized protein n=1 Tax=Pristionchus fissidentatus TaxID=1538716 RepID=A0AAV5WNB7_9BILA|nr:hypothetical protein PFISCL1PPCAC_24788 [Pristionchus fissidentatus]